MKKRKTLFKEDSKEIIRPVENIPEGEDSDEGAKPVDNIPEGEDSDEGAKPGTL